MGVGLISFSYASVNSQFRVISVCEDRNPRISLGATTAKNIYIPFVSLTIAHI